MKGRILTALLLVPALALAVHAEQAVTGSSAPEPAVRPEPVIINAAPTTPTTATPSQSGADNDAKAAEASNPLTSAGTTESAEEAKPESTETIEQPASPKTGATAPSTETKAPTEQAAPPAPPPPPTLTIGLNLATQRMTVAENGVTKHTWAISSAGPGYRTPTGTFKPQWMSRMWYSRQYDWSPMPHSIFFTGGTAIHGTYATRMLGRPASHGCVRLAPGNAAELYKLVGRHGKDRTRIVVHGVPNFRNVPPVAEHRNGIRRYYGGVPRGYRYMPGYAYSDPYFYRRPPRYVYGDPYYAPRPPRGYYVRPRRYVERGYFSGYYDY